MGTDIHVRSKFHVVVCFGTRPEVIKLAPVISALESTENVQTTLVTTAQHREMLDQMLETFGLTVDIDLQLMQPNQELSELTARAVSGLGSLMRRLEPDAVLVQGDTTTAFCAALTAFYERVPVGHVEAGLRTDNPYSPFPEEINRRLVSQVARWHFCPTESSQARLLKDGVPRGQTEVTGNTVIDALLSVADGTLANSVTMQEGVATQRRRILVTLHRRESQGVQQQMLSRMFARIAEEQDIEIIFPVHLSPAVRSQVLPELENRAHIHVVDPVDYLEFISLMKSAYLIVTDSGGVQEEAPSLNVPVLVVRDTTERPEGIAAGCARLSGTDPTVVEEQIMELIHNPTVYARMANARNPYGDGTAAKQIVARLMADLQAGRESEGTR
ncbi:MAG TPA: UDP-N-acetylglucosamine 2-epimerase (non-hydrolyzing) [Solirubrobacteraceae bacterium]|jgi:UDP-N-acetylglucosamine 2-epimerase (non-hydrolysing)